MANHNLAATELEFMNFFWNSTEEKCKRDIVSAFSQRKSGTTISFFLSKLAKKDFLISRREGRNFYYKPAITKSEYEQWVINERVNKSYGMSLEAIIANFCGKDPITDDDVNRIQKWLKELENELNNKE